MRTHEQPYVHMIKPEYATLITRTWVSAQKT